MGGGSSDNEGGGFSVECWSGVGGKRLVNRVPAGGQPRQDSVEDERGAEPYWQGR